MSSTRARGKAPAYRRAKELLIARDVGVAAAYPARDPARLQEVVEDALARGSRFVAQTPVGVCVAAEALLLAVPADCNDRDDARKVEADAPQR